MSKNDITGDTITTKASSEQYRNNYDRVFGKTRQLTQGQQEILDTLMNLPKDKESKNIFRLSKEQQDAVDDTAGILEENKQVCRNKKDKNESQ